MYEEGLDGGGAMVPDEDGIRKGDPFVDPIGQCLSCGQPLRQQEMHSEFGPPLCDVCVIRFSQEQEARFDTKQCLRCKRDTRFWTRKTWGMDGREYCVDCYKDVERLWTIANSCMECERQVDKAAEKVWWPPERLQKKDQWVKSGEVARRFVCGECFTKEAKRRFGTRMARGNVRRRKSGR